MILQYNVSRRLVGNHCTPRSHFTLRDQWLGSHSAWGVTHPSDRGSTVVSVMYAPVISHTTSLIFHYSVVNNTVGTVVDLGGGVRGCKCTPLWRLVMYFFVHNCTSLSMIMQQWHAQQQPGTVTHSQISSLLISRRLTRPRVASVQTSSMTGSWCGNKKFLGLLRNSPVAKPPFLNPPLR